MNCSPTPRKEGGHFLLSKNRSVTNQKTEQPRGIMAVGNGTTSREKTKCKPPFSRGTFNATEIFLCAVTHNLNSSFLDWNQSQASAHDNGINLVHSEACEGQPKD
eukprot:EG_transcript_44267